MFDSETAKYVTGLVTTGFLAATGLLYRGTHARIKRTEEALATKADVSELNRQRDHVVELFEKVADIREKMATHHEIDQLRTLIIERIPHG